MKYAIVANYILNAMLFIWGILLFIAFVFYPNKYIFINSLICLVLGSLNLLVYIYHRSKIKHLNSHSMNVFLCTDGIKIQDKQ